MPSPPAKVNVSGYISYDRVPVVDTPAVKLDYTQTIRQPARGVPVVAVDMQDVVLVQTVTDDAGNYALQVPSMTSMKLRVSAHLKGTNQDGARWDFAVRDNTSPAFANNPAQAALYVMEGRTFNSGTANSVRDLNAASGWNGERYSAARTAAPFAILDTIYMGMQRILKVDPQLKFKPINIFWSLNNRPAEGDIARGEIGNDRFSSDDKEYGIYLMGKEDVRTTEYLPSVILHEWTHYFEHFAARFDRIGGSHNNSDWLDMRLAFGEGFANAMSSMLRDDPRFLVTTGPQQAQGWGFLLTEIAKGAPKAWYGELAVSYALYQAYRVPEIGLANLYQAWVSDKYKQTPAFISLFSFADALRRRLNANGQSKLDSILREINTVNGADLDAYGAKQFLPPGISEKYKALFLPIYTSVVLNAAPVPVCVTQRVGSENLNKLSNRRYLRFNIPAQGRYRLTVQGDATAQPWIIVYQAGKESAYGDSEASSVSEAVVHEPFGAGDYVAEVSNVPWSDSDDKCFNITLTQ